MMQNSKPSLLSLQAPVNSKRPKDLQVFERSEPPKHRGFRVSANILPKSSLVILRHMFCETTVSTELWLVLF